MIKRQIRISEEAKREMRIASAQTGKTNNAVIVEVIANIKNWQLAYKHERITLPLSKSIVIEYSDELRNTMLKRADQINQNSKAGKKITQEMILHQVLESYFGTNKTKSNDTIKPNTARRTKQK